MQQTAFPSGGLLFLFHTSSSPLDRHVVRRFPVVPADTSVALFAEIRSTTPQPNLESNLPGRLFLLNAAAARPVSFTLSTLLIILVPFANKN